MHKFVEYIKKYIKKFWPWGYKKVYVKNLKRIKLSKGFFTGDYYDGQKELKLMLWDLILCNVLINTNSASKIWRIDFQYMGTKESADIVYKLLLSMCEEGLHIKLPCIESKYRIIDEEEREIIVAKRAVSVVGGSHLLLFDPNI